MLGGIVIIILHTNPKYQAMIDDLEALSIGTANDTQLLENILALEKIADDDNDDILKVIALFHKSDIPYRNGNMEEAREVVVEALHLSTEINFTFYVMRCYNSLAAIDSQTTDYYTSISNYLKAFQIAKVHPEYKFGCQILNNIGNLFVWLDEHQIALNYLLDSYHKYYEEQQSSEYILNLVIMNIVEEYSLLGDYEKAQEWANLDVYFLDDAKMIIDNILNVNTIDSLYKSGKRAEIPSLYESIVSRTSEDENFIYIFRSYLRLLEYAIREKDANMANNIFHNLERLDRQAYIKTFEYDYIMLKVQYYQTFQANLDDGEIAKNLLNDYIVSSENVVNQMRYSYTRRLVIEMELLKLTNEKEAALNESRQLQKDIELDYFTKILNKVSMEKYIERSIQEKNSLNDPLQALLIFDIDHFKDVNDNFGHEFGDNILLELVDMASSCCSKNMLLGRFGGDEFMLFVNQVRHTNFVHTFAQELLEKARQIKVKDDKHITLSIGIHILRNEDDFKTAFQCADQALYEAKHQGRNRYYVYDVVREN